MNLLNYFISQGYQHWDPFCIETSIGMYYYRLEYLDQSLYNLVRYSKAELYKLYAEKTQISYNHLLLQTLNDIRERQFFEDLQK